MRMGGQTNGDEVVRGLIQALNDLARATITHVQAEASVNGHQYDALIEATIGDQAVRFVVESKATAYPRDVRLAVDEFAPTRAEANMIPVFTAPRIGYTARRLLKEAGVGYADGSGTLYVDASSAPALALHIDRERPPLPQLRRARELFRGQGAQVLHVLLARFATRREWNITDLAQESGAAVSAVHRTFTRLEADGTVDKTGSGPKTVRHVTDPNMILDEWSEHHSLAVYQPRRYAGWTQEHGRLERDVCAALEAQHIEYALTLGSGAQLVAPFATVVPQIDILVPRSANLSFLVDSSVGLVEVGSDGGENIVLRTTDERWPLMQRQESNGLAVASDIQLYLDLMASPRRGRELAQRIREQRLDWD